MKDKVFKCEIRRVNQGIPWISFTTGTKIQCVSFVADYLRARYKEDFESLTITIIQTD